MSHKCQKFIPAHEIEDGHIVRLSWDMIDPITQEMAERIRPVIMPKQAEKPMAQKRTPKKTGKTWSIKK